MRYAKMPDSSENSDDSGSGSEGESESNHSASSGSESDSASDSEEEKAREQQLAVLQEQLKIMQKQILDLQNAKNNSHSRKERRKKKKAVKPRRERLERGAKNDHAKDEKNFDGQLGVAGPSGLSAPVAGGQFPQGGFMPNDISMIGGTLAAGKFYLLLS